ncbi:MAG TPA: extracellular solute-binding protein [Acidimicrobiia bacterium]|nr:extracellular solute-binding protein [Acidimicrobiia bacterium]
MRRSTSITVLALLAVACGGDDASPATTTTPPPTVTQATVPATTPTTAVAEAPSPDGRLVVWVSDPAVADAVSDRGEAYTAETGVEVHVITIFSAPGDDFLDELVAGEFPETPEGADEPDIPPDLRRQPDLVLGPHTWLARLAEAGLAAPVDLPEGLPSGAVDAVMIRGFTVGVPVALDAIVQYRNPDLMAERPVDVSNISCDGTTCLLLPGDGDAGIHLPFVLTLGGYVFGPDPASGYAAGDVGVASAEAIAASAVLQEMIEEGTVVSAADREDARSRFGAGEAALIWDGAAALDLPGTAEVLPTIAASPAVSPVWVTAAWVNASGDLETEAAEFALEHLGSVAGSTAIARALGQAPVWSEGATDGERVIIDAAATGAAVPYIAETGVALEALAEAFARIHAGTSAGDALTDAADEIRFAD